MFLHYWLLVTVPRFSSTLGAFVQLNPGKNHHLTSIGKLETAKPTSQQSAAIFAS